MKLLREMLISLLRLQHPGLPDDVGNGELFMLTFFVVLLIAFVVFAASVT